MKKLEDESSHLAMDLMDAPRYILELRDEIKALRAEVEVLKPKCTKCNGKGYIHYPMNGAVMCECCK